MGYAEEVAERLTLMLGGQSRNAFAKKIGMPESTFRSYFEGIAMSLESAARIAAGGGVSLEWLATGRGAMLATPVAHWTSDFQPGFAEAQAEWTPGNLFSLPLMRLDDGKAVLHHDQSVLAVPRAILRELGVSPDAVACFVVEDSSSRAKFPDGTTLIVDTNPSRPPGQGAYYLLAGDDGFFIRLISRRTDGDFDLVADHPDARPETVTSLNGPTIAGRIVWAGGRV